MTKLEKDIVQALIDSLAEGNVGTARGYAQLLGLTIPDKVKD